MQWDYRNLAFKQQFKGNPTFAVSVPSDGVFGNYSLQRNHEERPQSVRRPTLDRSISPTRASLNYIGGYAHPARYQGLREAEQGPAAARRPLPAAGTACKRAVPERYAKQTNAATKVLQEQWGPKVAG